jgi:ElaB/YqjD/DUF883 family membrane-anchored ribosome-binding protein
MKGPNDMDQQTQSISDALVTLAEDARHLMSVTADVAGEKVSEARRRLGAALERGKTICDEARAGARERAALADEAIHSHPYQAMAIGIGVGAFLGYLIGRRGSHNGN